MKFGLNRLAFAMREATGESHLESVAIKLDYTGKLIETPGFKLLMRLEEQVYAAILICLYDWNATL